MKKYTYYYAWINETKKLEMFQKMIALFDGCEIAEIEEDEIADEIGGIDEFGYHVRMRVDNEKNSHYEILVKGFDFEEEIKKYWEV